MIEEEIGPHGYGPLEWPIVRRIIHSTADFDFAGKNEVLFHPSAIQKGMAALGSGCDIVADVNGVAGLLNKRNLKEYGNRIVCKVSDEDAASRAIQDGSTRSAASMRLSAEHIDGGVVAAGSAPTALLEVLQMAKEGVATPVLIVGLPVGFICAVESKEELAASEIPHITNRGRKGGSPSAAAVINALFRLIREPPA
ncbi:precorrin isomerase [Cenarchaeum symbiosum A]|uniref:Precorrin isomerase n=1 Tax=Cenarchaeum symbiosum (strain A) TaxID=414004 RepID=A0RYY4_CENSY|nr:precorrin isomerase [Cenarchaeum symbiosum A]